MPWKNTPSRCGSIRAWRPSTGAAMTRSGRSLSALLQDAGISDYSIHLDAETNTLFGVLWRARRPRAWTSCPSHPVMQRWWAHMADIMETNPDNEPVAVPLETVFHHEMTPTPAHVAVIDIGKTNAKVALVDTASDCRDRRRARAPNGVLPGRPYPHYDVEGSGASSSTVRWRAHAPRTASTRSSSPRTARPRRCSMRAGDLALPVLDYEHDGPDELAADYDARAAAVRRDRLAAAAGGAQSRRAALLAGSEPFPRPSARAAAILTYPQYWAFRLSGVAANEATSLGCHTDLWNPHAADFSSLVERMGWRGRLRAGAAGADCPRRRSRPAVAAATGLRVRHAGLLRHPRFQRLAAAASAAPARRLSPSSRPAPG